MKTAFNSQYLTVLDHPLCEHNLGVIRNKDVNSDGFRNSLRRLASLLIFEAAKTLPLKEYSVETPLAQCRSKMLDNDVNIIFAPILRAGLALSDVASEIIPQASVQHVGMYRDEITLKPVWYYDKTPVEYSNPQNKRVFILDPMLATGGSASAAISFIKKRGCSHIRLVNLIAAPEGIKRMQEDHPDVDIYVAGMDDHLNEHGYIVPGLGDAGDRLFGTK